MTECSFLYFWNASDVRAAILFFLQTNMAADFVLCVPFILPRRDKREDYCTINSLGVNRSCISLENLEHVAYPSRVLP